MEDYIKIVLEWIGEKDFFSLWFFFFFSNFAENIFPPWPGDTVTAFGGFFIAGNVHSSFGWTALVTSTLLGNLAGGFFMFIFGKKMIHWIQNHEFRFKKYIYSEEEWKKTLSWFEKYSAFVILFSRFSAGIRFFVSIVAGMVSVKWYEFLVYFSIAVFLWCGLLIGGGYYLGKNWENVIEILGLYNRIVIVVIVLVLSVFLLYKRSRREIRKQN